MISEKALQSIYGESSESEKRFSRLSQQFEESFGGKAEFFSAPGRTEIIGNHTDHNGGKVIASSIQQDTICAARPNQTDVVRIISEGYKDKIEICLEKGTSTMQVCKLETENPTMSLVRGLLHGTKELGFCTGGFDAYISTNVIPAAGVSSSASFEMLLMAVINYFFNENRMQYLDYAKIGQYAENHFWGKESGLMDQLACAVGGPVFLDFSAEARIQRLNFSLEELGYRLVIVNTGKGHGDLSREYSEIPAEMKQIAGKLGGKRLCNTSKEELLKKITEVQKKVPNDRALLRAFHFFEENDRVEKAAEAILRQEIRPLFALIQQSGDSSWKWLQNCVVPLSDPREQKIPLILALSELFIQKIGDGCCRVHGGGFAGVIMCILPEAEVEKYINFIANVTDCGQIYPMKLRKTGAVHIDSM